jgi:ubiquinone/menaquinone biosynthesis C-methylase UbiE
MLRNSDVYRKKIADDYERLIACEDHEGNIPKTLFSIADFHGKTVVDLGAGTGRLSCMAAPLARQVVAVDYAPDMLRVAAEKLARIRADGWRIVTADMRELPLPDRCVDIVTAGWSVCYLANANNQDGERNLNLVLDECSRILRDDGTIIILETLGTGVDEPVVQDFLRPYFERLSGSHGFRHVQIRTDYRFDSAEEAAEIVHRFFGEEAGRKTRERGSPIVPEFTGVWWKTVRAGDRME